MDIRQEHPETSAISTQNVRILVLMVRGRTPKEEKHFAKGRGKIKGKGNTGGKNRTRDRTGQSLTKEERICVLLVNVLIALWQIADRIV